jgi:hypothetical protein
MRSDRRHCRSELATYLWHIYILFVQGSVVTLTNACECVLCRKLSQFQVLAQIGSGHASVVYLVWDTVASRYLALKCYKGAALRSEIGKQVRPLARW